MLNIYAPYQSEKWTSRLSFLIVEFKFHSTGAMILDDKQKQITGRIVIDNKNEYSITGELSQTKKGQLFTFNPYIEIIVPNAENIRISSKVEYVARKSLDSEITLSGLSKQPINAKGKTKPDAYAITLRFILLNKYILEKCSL